MQIPTPVFGSGFSNLMNADPDPPPRFKMINSAMVHRLSISSDFSVGMSESLRLNQQLFKTSATQNIIQLTSKIFLGYILI